MCSTNTQWQSQLGIARPAQVMLTEWLFKFGVPGPIHPHQGQSFESLLIQHCHLYQVDKSGTTLYHLAGQGQCEPFNRVLHDLSQMLPDVASGIGFLVSRRCYFILTQRRIKEVTFLFETASLASPCTFFWAGSRTLSQEKSRFG